jgi:hypothetical protein
MRIVAAFICLIIICNINLSAQKNQTYTIKAGTSLKSYFPVQERYRYPDFVTGLVIFENGSLNKARLNLNYLRGEFEFIQSNDTLTFARKKEIRLIIAAQDTFY